MQVTFSINKLIYHYYHGKTNSYHGENFYRYITNDKISTIPKLEYDFWHICVCAACMYTYTHTHTHRGSKVWGQYNL